MEIFCFIYSEKDGNKIKSWNIAQQFEAQEEYRQRRINNEEVGYYEGINFPLDLVNIKYNSVKKVFELKTDRELIESGDRVLKKYEKLVLNTVVNKELYEMYREGLVLNQQYERVYKINKNNILERKNILELFMEGFVDKEIRDAVLEKVITLLDRKYFELRKKYPDFEINNFNYKITMANMWNSLSDPAKMRIIRSEDRLNGFNVLMADFYVSLTEEEKNNNEVIFNKMNELVSNIIEKEKIYKENYENLLKMRNYFTGRLRDMTLTENSIRAYIDEVNGYYGEAIIKVEEIELPAKYYSTIPLPNLDVYR